MHWTHEQLEGVINKQDVCRTNKSYFRQFSNCTEETVHVWQWHLKKYSMNWTQATHNWNLSTCLEYGKWNCKKDEW